jgi:hypothetical protein
MPPPPRPTVVQVPVPRHDINISLQDILTPLIQLSRQPHVAEAVASAPDVQPHLVQLGELARQLRDVVQRINEINPNLLAPTPQRRPPNT